jgi:hypothetical protein
MKFQKEEKHLLLQQIPELKLSINAALGSLETSAEQTSKPFRYLEHTEFLKNLGVNS